MRRVCAWCNTDFGTKPGLDGEITHGICPPCLDRVLNEVAPAKLSDFLEGLGVPVFLMDDDVRVRAGNLMAAALLGKELDALTGVYGGEAIDCVHSREPGGCGKTVHCKTCVIRNTVTDTYRTGRSYARVPATANQEGADGLRSIRLLISTEKSGAGVLLRIDEVAAGAQSEKEMPEAL